MSLPGFPSGPFTKTGRSVLVPPGPWHYAMTGLGVYYKADSSALESVVPKPLKVGSGAVFAYLVEIVSWSPNAAEFNVEAPDLVQYSEAAFFVEVEYQGRKYAYCPYMWVDKDLSLLRGLLAGWPKKFASIAITRLHPLLEPLSAPRKGLRLGGHASRAGYRLYSIKVELEEDQPRDSIPLTEMGPIILPRYFAAIAPGLQAVNELVEVQCEAKARAWRGKGEIEVVGGFNDELEAFKPAGPVEGYYFHLYLKPVQVRPVGRIEGF